MRRLGLLVAVALMMGATTSFAQGNKEAASFERLSKYLRLTEAPSPFSQYLKRILIQSPEIIDLLGSLCQYYTTLVSPFQRDS